MFTFIRESEQSASSGTGTIMLKASPLLPSYLREAYYSLVDQAVQDCVDATSNRRMR